ncbi:hypothetical protein [Pseudoalteromonas porphyrae]|uniref:Lipoprotein n=1 Tax=Pseudoalteromonas porphyrae TaxID=187330 RepID=A0A0N1MUH0_9GAMM|nr:hypothetical protein [Pseudoalteromonas porphyrae]KPH65635.1 hypothetical protein ADS77_01525 [Pseudoalteromonas porphyrae]
MEYKLYSSKFRLLKAFLIIITLVIFSSGCTVKLVSSYDEKTDNAVTELQKRVETFFIEAEGLANKPECKYEKHITFYQDTKVQVSAISVRAGALEKNEKTEQLVALLGNSIDTLEQLHKIDCFKPEQVVTLRSSFNSSITAILKLELAKKRGE